MRDADGLMNWKNLTTACCWCFLIFMHEICYKWLVVERYLYIYYIAGGLLVHVFSSFFSVLSFFIFCAKESCRFLTLLANFWLYIKIYVHNINSKTCIVSYQLFSCMHKVVIKCINKHIFKTIWWFSSKTKKATLRFDDDDDSDFMQYLFIHLFLLFAHIIPVMNDAWLEEKVVAEMVIQNLVLPIQVVYLYIYLALIFTYLFYIFYLYIAFLLIP